MNLQIKRFSTSLLALVLLFLSNAIFAQNSDANKKLRLFIIGNSFSQNATAYLPDIAKEANVSLSIGRAELGGCTLERHWKHAEKAEANSDDKEGKPYKGKSLRMLLSEGTWDVVTIQQASIYSVDVNTYRPYAKKLYDYIKSIQPNAKIVMHQTWAYRWDAKTFKKEDRSPLVKDDKVMWQNSRAAYHTIAKELGVQIMPVGDAFRKLVSNSKFAYQQDANFNFAKPAYPKVPVQTNSLHGGYFWSNKKFTHDANHANDAGKFLGALVWYASLFHGSPEDIKFVPEKVSPELAVQLKKVAAQVVKGKNKIKY